jgi:ubiquinone/menaquinone biosynthesis C-methylase UbiE
VLDPIPAYLIALQPFLRCPLTHSGLQHIHSQDLVNFRQAVKSGAVTHLDGSPIKTDFQWGLINEDRSFAYLVSEDIIAMLPDLAVALKPEAVKPEMLEMAAEKQNLRSFYDEIGWTADEAGDFVDATRFEDLRPVAAEYIERCHERFGRFLPYSGQFILDIASGPVQYDAYARYSLAYNYHICGDLSVRALRAARERLGNRGIYMLCDITNIPIKDDGMDGFMSLHTIYHVPQEQQKQAFSELQRVLKLGRQGAVVYSWGPHSPLMRWGMLPWTIWQSLKGTIKRMIGRAPAADTASQPPAKPYRHQHDYDWYRQEIRPLGFQECHVWRSINVTFMRRYIRPGWLGRMLLRITFMKEELFPNFLGRFGQYPILICKK